MNNMTKHCLLATIVLFLLCSTEGVEKCAEPCLIYSASSQINGIEVSTSRVVNLVSSLRGAVAVDVHVKEKTIYWSDVQQHFIKRMKLQSSGNVEDIITDDLGEVHGLAVEWASNLIYWTDFSKGRVGVASLDGSRRKLLFVEDVGKPRGVALYPKKGLLFWTDWGSPPKIERASLAGLNRTVLVDLSSSNHIWPNAIFVDYTEDRIYWIDAWIDAIDSTDLNGNNRRQITNPIRPSHNMHPFDFTVYDDVLYWSDWNTYSIEKLNWTTGAYLGRFDIVTYAPEFVFGVALLHQSRQPASAGNQLCKGNNGSCSHLCLLTPDGYHCACPDGFTLESDEKTCQAGTGQFLLFADGKKGRVMKASPNNARLLTSVPLSSSIISRPVALGYDFVEDRVYWTDITLHTISRSFLNGSMQEIIFHQNVQTPDGLAVDPVGRNLYWTDTGTNKLEVSKLDGSYRKSLITSSLDEPRDIILDIKQGIMYWTDWGSRPKIEKAEMSGKQRVVLVSASLSWPNGLTLDREKNRLYWVDASYDKLEYLNLNNNQRVTLIVSSSILPHPFGLTLFGDHLYWTDWYYDAVYRANKETGGDVTAFITGLGQPMDIHGYNLTVQVIPVTEECKHSNGGCSHLCLLTPSGKECACADGLILNEDGRTCHAPPYFLLFADAAYGRIMKVSPYDNRSLHYLPLSSIISRPVALGYDPMEDRVYWSDVTRSTISRSFLNGSYFEDIFYRTVQIPDGLAVDTIGRNLYWTDTGTNKLEVSKLDGSYRTALITSGLDEPRDIILNVNEGIMYWTDWGSHAKIEKADMTGKRRVILVGTSLRWPNGLTLDEDQNRLYWVDASYHKLEYLNLINNHRVTLIDSSLVLPHPFGLTLLADHLYWTDWQRNAVYRANKENGGNIAAFITGIGQPMDIHGYNLSEHVTQGNSSCQFNNGGCSHMCLLAPNGRACACPAHLALKDDEKTCHFDASRAQLLIQSLDGPYLKAGAVPIVPHFTIRRPVALDIDLRDNRIYWTDVTLNTISRVFINGSSPEVLVAVNVSNSDGLAVDPLGGNIYWTDTGVDKIEVSRLDGSMRKTLIDQNLDEPRDIILHLNKGLMYWCDWGVDHKIEVANMDGNSRRLLVSRGLYWPNGLTLDQINNWLYWVDAWNDILKYYDLESHMVTTLIDSSSILPHPFGLTLLEDYLYWTDWSLDVVYRANRTAPSTNLTVFASGLGQPMDIHAYDRSQTLPVHPCSSSYGGCSHLCLLRPGGYRCSCPDHLAPGDVCITSLVTLSSSSTQTSIATSFKYRTPTASVMSSSISTSTGFSSSQTTTSSLSPTISTSSVPAVSSHRLPSSPSPTEKKTTVSPTYETPPTPVPTECRAGTCKNGGTCIIPGYFCSCIKYYVWRLCTIYVGGSAVEMKLSLKSEGGWSEKLFKIAVAEACSNYFCINGKCESQSKAGRVRRSDKPTYFRPSDIYILGTSLGAVNALQVEFAVLFPSVDGQAPQVTSPEEVVQMVDKTKDNIEKAVGGTIQKTSVVPEVRVTDKPEKEPITPKKGKSTGDNKGPSIAPIAAGVGVGVVVVAALAVFVIYRLRRKQRPNDRGTGDNIQLEQEWTNNACPTVSFDNPGFREDVIYDTISAVTGRAVEANLKQAKPEGLLELRIPDEKGNSLASNLPLDDRSATYEPLSVAGRSNPTYAMASLPGEDLPEQYAALQKKGTSYEALSPNTVFNGVANPLHDDHEEYLKPIEAQSMVSGDDADDGHYLDLNRKEESQA